MRGQECSRRLASLGVSLVLSLLLLHVEVWVRRVWRMFAESGAVVLRLTWLLSLVVVIDSGGLRSKEVSGQICLRQRSCCWVSQSVMRSREVGVVKSRQSGTPQKSGKTDDD